jgi:hypothetical protein
MTHTDEVQGLVRTTGRLAGIGGAAGLMSLFMVLAGEVTQGESFMGTGLAVVAGWLGFLGACLLVPGLLGLAIRHAGELSRAGRLALLSLAVATAVMAGASSTLALVVPAIAERLPELATEPPAAVPATFILSGLAMGVSGLVLAIALRRAGTLPARATTLLMVASVVTILPLPSRYLLLGFAVAAVLGLRQETRGTAPSRTVAEPAL